MEPIREANGLLKHGVKHEGQTYKVWCRGVLVGQRILKADALDCLRDAIKYGIGMDQRPGQ